MYPIYYAEAKPSPEVRAVEAAMSLMEPPLTVRGIQYANESDAALARRHEAKHRVREADRMARAAGAACVWCGQTIAAGRAIVIVSGEAMHVGGCQPDFEATVFGSDAVAA